MIFSLLLACQPTDEPPTPVEAHAPDPGDAERVIVIGDGGALAPTLPRSWPVLLATNDDALFPEWTGHDLAHRDTAKQIEVVVLATGGEYWGRLAAGESAWCTCTTSDCPATPCWDTADPRPTLVVVELGAYDLIASALQLLVKPDLRANPTPLLDTFRADVRAVLATIDGANDTPVALRVLDLPDPSDGVGDLAEIVSTLFPLDQVELIPAALATTVLDGMQEAIVDGTTEVGGQILPMRQTFLGHGYHYDDAAAPAYVAGDPTLWYRNVLDPNSRGAHELRRLLWQEITGEALDALPDQLPAEGLAGLPEVPEIGWAVAVTDSSIPLTFGPPAYPNQAADPTTALGPPGSSLADIVAIGPTGSFLVVELGALCIDGLGADLVVLEFGVASGGTPEPYRVSVAAEPAGPFTPVADGLGELAFDLDGTGISSFRYVRIDSLAPEAEILAGAGSQYYPGPEIDAVGGVWPAP